MTQSLAEAVRDRENIRSELFRELEAVRRGNGEQERAWAVRQGVSGPCPRARWSLIRPDPPESALSMALPLRPSTPSVCCTWEQSTSWTFHPTDSCEQCPTSWLPFQGSCYSFSVVWAQWEEAQRNCSGASAHLVIIRDLEEQVGGPGSLYGGGWRSSLQGAWPVPSLWAAVSGKPAHLSFHPGLPKSEYKRPRLLVGPQGRAPREQGPGLSVGRRSLAQLQVRKGRWGRGRSAPGASAWTHLRDSLGTAKLATRTWLRHKFGALYVISQVYA